ncbi:hypothetical protein I204_07091 [Kwoniella mangroviensis CBS 8886]|nr:hypothetical protein I204_07091 [Kwoniella mangroviensis CBS 8886]
MPPRPSTSISSAFARLSLSRGLQTTAPLPPPTTPLPPSDIPSSSTSAALAHLPPILPSSSSSSLTTLPNSTSEAISLISSQSTSSSGRYLIARLYSRNYLLHPKDILTLPQLKPIQAPGSTLSLTKVLEVGSRDYAIRSQASNAAILKRSMNWKSKRLSSFEGIPEGLVDCNLTILEHTKSPLERILKKKRRKGYKKTIEHKQGYTRLRVGDILLKGEKEI